MNRLAKGAIATGIGVVLLMGGGGTFALWNGTSNLTDSGVTAGQLRVSSTAGSWKTAGGTAITSITAYRIVPGETLVYTTPVTVIAEGPALQATLTLAPGSIAAPANSVNAADARLAAYLTRTAQVVMDTTNAPHITTTATPNVYSVAPTSATGETVNVEVRIAFSNSTTGGTENDAMGGTVNLSNLAVTLTQTAPATTS